MNTAPSFFQKNCLDAWFDAEPTGSRLRVVLPRGMENIDPEPVVALSLLVGGQSVTVEFRFLAWIKGQRVYEASALRLEDAQGRSSLAPSSRFSGPFQGDERCLSKLLLAGIMTRGEAHRAFTDPKSCTGDSSVTTGGAE